MGCLGGLNQFQGTYESFKDLCARRSNQGLIYNVFGNVVAIAFQITFRTKMHANDFFYFLKIIFDINISKQSKIYKPY
jgi:hypothetical protein